MPLTLSAGSVLVLFGLALFVIGNVADYTAVAVIGGVLVVGVGAVITAEGGVVRRAGETKTIVNESANKTSVTVEPTYEQVRTPQNLPLGLLTMLGGGLLALQPLPDEYA